jgi:hypothetical protein
MIEASVGELKAPDGSKAGYEIYILMEWCAGTFNSSFAERDN